LRGSHLLRPKRDSLLYIDILPHLKEGVFSAFRYNEHQKAYVYCGQFAAPVRTANRKLPAYVEKELSKF